MGPTDHIERHAVDLLGAARAIYDGSGEPGSVEAASAVLAHLEEALQLLSAAWYQVAADAAPGIVERRRPVAGPVRPPSPAVDTLSREQSARLTGTLHDVASALARCGRVCRDAAPTLQLLVEKRPSSMWPHEEAQFDRPSSARGRAA